MLSPRIPIRTPRPVQLPWRKYRPNRTRQSAHREQAPKRTSPRPPLFQNHQRWEAGPPTDAIAYLAPNRVGNGPNNDIQMSSNAYLLDSIYLWTEIPKLALGCRSLIAKTYYSANRANRISRYGTIWIILIRPIVVKSFRISLTLAKRLKCSLPTYHCVPTLSINANHQISSPNNPN